MKTRTALFFLYLVFVLQGGLVQADERADYIRENYTKYEKRIPVRDGVTLFTAIYKPNAHTDGGRSPASRKMLEASFSDAFRSLYPDVKKYPGASHQGGNRIDQLYYKGNGLKNTSTRVASAWLGGFPSDHFLIISE